MTKKHIVQLAVAIASVSLLATGCKPTANASHSQSIPDASYAPASCHRGGTDTEPTPDPHCTPGATNPDVTQANIGETICKSGWTKTIRPPASKTNKLKTQQITGYGYSDVNPRDYEEDHLISLELGGAPSDPKNLWPEPGSTPNRKDKVENAAHDAICSHKLTLEQAQHAIATDWVGLGHQLGAL